MSQLRGGCGREVLLQSVRPIGLLQQGFSQVTGGAGVRGLPEPGCFVTGLGCECRLHFDIAARRGEILLQSARPVGLLLQGLSQICGASVRSLPELGCFVTGLGCECRLRFDIAARSCEILLQSARPIGLLLQGFSQICGASVRRLPELSCFVTGLGRERRLRLDLAALQLRILLQSARLIGLLLQGFSEVGGACVGRLPELTCFVASLGGARGQRLRIVAYGREILLQSIGPVAFLLQRLLQFSGFTVGRPLDDCCFAALLVQLIQQRLDLTPGKLKFPRQRLGPLVVRSLGGPRRRRIVCLCWRGLCRYVRGSAEVIRVKRCPRHRKQRRRETQRRGSTDHGPRATAGREDLSLSNRSTLSCCRMVDHFQK